MNKFLTKEHAKKAGIKTPIYKMIREGEDYSSKVNEIHKTFPYPLVIKPVSGGSSVGVTIARTPAEILDGLEKAISYGGGALVEEYIDGREASCGIINNFRNQDIYVLPAVEITHSSKNGFFDYDAKYSGESREVCPGHFSESEKREIEKVSALIHTALGLKHYSKSDFIVSPRRGVYFLEVNTLPGLTSESIFPKSLEAVGMSMKDFLHHTISLALDGR
jgi:D-alanine-D-alanine ligase